jgi:GNAT superfamily N-acetyltransferase
MVTQLPLDGVPLVKTGPSGVTIRLAREDEVETLRQIERSAAQAFRLIEAFSWLSVGEVQGADMHFALIEAGTNWVAVDGDDHPLGFLSAEIAGRQLHICEISVDHLHQGFGLGRKLIDYAVDAATRLGLDAVTLTTFRTIPWNCPFYERLGFRVLGEEELSPRLHDLLDLEDAHGLRRDTRCAMQFDLPQ